MNNTQKKGFKQRCKDLWHYFTTYEKIWFFTILVLAVVFSFVFPETDDPTYTVDFSKSLYEQSATGVYDTFDFTGTTGEFVIVGITVDGEEYAMLDVSDYAEFTVDPSDPDTLTLKIATYDKKNKQYTAIPIYPDTEIAFECYFDGDDEQDCQLVVSVVNTNNNQVLYAPTAIILDMDQLDSDVVFTYKLQENSFLVAVGWITVLYVLDVILNIACELLISKQSKWNFIVSLGVEIVEILVCIFCLYSLY